MTATLDRPDADAAPSVEPTWREQLRPSVTGSGGWAVTAIVTLIAALLRFLRLDQPDSTLSSEGRIESPGQMFDEVYYACDSYNLLRHGVERAVQPAQGDSFCGPLADVQGSFVVHPPLGKWLIALGEQVAGFNSFGWRLSAAVFGVLTVLLVVRIGRRMLGSTLLGGLAGLLLAFDGLHFVQSRIAMVDVFVCFWVLAGFGALVVDRDRCRERLSRNSDEELLGGGYLGRRPWRVVAGVCIGAALATKWSALFPVAVLLALTLFWEAGARRTAGVRAPWRTSLRRTTLPLLGMLVLLPLVVYVLSWTGWFVTSEGYDRQWASDHPASTWGGVFPDVMRSWWHYHAEILRFHQGLESKHPYQSHALSWPFLGRPVSYYYPPGISEGEYGCQVPSCSREVLAIGTPALWWMMIPVTVGLVARWVSRRDWRAAALVLMMAVSILAWIPSDLRNRTMFLFYALPSAPFLCLGAALLAGWLLGRARTWRRTLAASGIGLWTALVVGNFVYLYPVLAAVTLPYAEWYGRMWFRSWI